jgi:hypothetical protein
MFALQAAIAEFANGGVGVVEQPLFVIRIAPRPGDDPRTVTGADPMLVGIDDRSRAAGSTMPFSTSSDSSDLTRRAGSDGSAWWA